MPAYSMDGPKFDLGTSLAGTDASGNLINADKLGVVVTFPAFTTTGSAVRTTRKVHYGGPLTCVALRNLSGVTLYGKNLARLKLTAGVSPITSVDGYSGASLAQDGVVLVDPYLPSAGVAANDIFWAVLKGPALGKTPRNGEDFSGDIAVGVRLIANGTIGAGTTSSTTAGKLANVTYFVGATAGITQNANMASGVICRALSARTTGETDSDILCMWNINLF